MNTDQIEDLKQFINARISQSETSLESRLDHKIDDLWRDLKAEINILRSDMNDGFAGVADAIGVIHDKLDDHEERIIKLEANAA